MGALKGGIAVVICGYTRSLSMFSLHLVRKLINVWIARVFSSVRNRPEFHNRLSVFRHRLIIDYLITFSEVFSFALESYIFNLVHTNWCKNSVRFQFSHAANGNIKKQNSCFSFNRM